mmetsp:Transcript_19691/g.49214  ORF Transcript_19691/g.49214 Transcript_19691/m.49214 type:complete len:292 (-) Transcript_19691:2500-3375(-)
MESTSFSFDATKRSSIELMLRVDDLCSSSPFKRTMVNVRLSPPCSLTIPLACFVICSRCRRRSTCLADASPSSLGSAGRSSWAHSDWRESVLYLSCLMKLSRSRCNSLFCCRLLVWTMCCNTAVSIFLTEYVLFELVRSLRRLENCISTKRWTSLASWLCHSSRTASRLSLMRVLMPAKLACSKERLSILELSATVSRWAACFRKYSSNLPSMSIRLRWLALTKKCREKRFCRGRITSDVTKLSLKLAMEARPAAPPAAVPAVSPLPISWSTCSITRSTTASSIASSTAWS